MKILFSPSEAKSMKFETKNFINEESFCCKELYGYRVEILNLYQKLLETGDISSLSKLFGIKEKNRIYELKSKNLFQSFTCKAVLRYSGVAYGYLDYPSLSTSSKSFIDNNTIIFSNLFGPIMAKDDIPFYKLKQGETLNGIKTDVHYKKHFLSKLDEMLKDELIIDLRAKFYEKFYTPNQQRITMKFLKNGKTLSHWAKAYRGLILRELSKRRPNSKAQFDKIEFENLKIVEIVESGKILEYIFEIIE